MVEYTTRCSVNPVQQLQPCKRINRIQSITSLYYYAIIINNAVDPIKSNIRFYGKLSIEIRMYSHGSDKNRGDVILISSTRLMDALDWVSILCTQNSTILL